MVGPGGCALISPNDPDVEFHWLPVPRTGPDGTGRYEGGLVVGLKAPAGWWSAVSFGRTTLNDAPTGIQSRAHGTGKVPDCKVDVTTKCCRSSEFQRECEEWGSRAAGVSNAPSDAFGGRRRHPLPDSDEDADYLTERVWQYALAGYALPDASLKRPAGVEMVRMAYGGPPRHCDGGGTSIDPPVGGPATAIWTTPQPDGSVSNPQKLDIKSLLGWVPASTNPDPLVARGTTWSCRSDDCTSFDAAARNPDDPANAAQSAVGPGRPVPFDGQECPYGVTRALNLGGDYFACGLGGCDNGEGFPPDDLNLLATLLEYNVPRSSPSAKDASLEGFGSSGTTFQSVSGEPSLYVPGTRLRGATDEPPYCSAVATQPDAEDPNVMVWRATLTRTFLDNKEEGGVNVQTGVPLAPILDTRPGGKNTFYYAYRPWVWNNARTTPLAGFDANTWKAAVDKIPPAIGLRAGSHVNPDATLPEAPGRAGAGPYFANADPPSGDGNREFPDNGENINLWGWRDIDLTVEEFEQAPPLPGCADGLKRPPWTIGRDEQPSCCVNVNECTGGPGGTPLDLTGADLCAELGFPDEGFAARCVDVDPRFGYTAKVFPDGSEDRGEPFPGLRIDFPDEDAAIRGTTWGCACAAGTVRVPGADLTAAGVVAASRETPPRLGKLLCADKRECDDPVNRACPEGATCIELPGSFACQCNEGLVLAQGEEGSDLCLAEPSSCAGDPGPCGDLAQCVNLVGAGNYDCVCPEGTRKRTGALDDDCVAADGASTATPPPRDSLGAVVPQEGDEALPTDAAGATINVRIAYEALFQSPGTDIEGDDSDRARFEAWLGREVFAVPECRVGTETYSERRCVSLLDDRLSYLLPRGITTATGFAARRRESEEVEADAGSPGSTPAARPAGSAPAPAPAPAPTPGAPGPRLLRRSLQPSPASPDDGFSGVDPDTSGEIEASYEMNDSRTAAEAARRAAAAFAERDGEPAAGLASVGLIAVGARSRVSTLVVLEDGARASRVSEGAVALAGGLLLAALGGGWA